MKKKITITSIIIAFVIIVALVVYFLTKGPSVIIELSYANPFPEGHPMSKLADSWVTAISERTEGVIQITYDQEISSTAGSKILEDVISGKVDIAAGAINHDSEAFPVLHTIDLPLGYKNAYVSTMVINDFYSKFKPKSFSKVKIFYFSAQGPEFLHTKKPVRKLEDLNGVRIRAEGFGVNIAEALGGIPVEVAQPEAYEALAMWKADATIAPLEVLYRLNQRQVVSYMTEYNFGDSAGCFVVMNTDKWNSLPEDFKTIIDELNKEWIEKAATEWTKADQQGFKYNTEKGNQVFPLTPQERVRWDQAVATVVDEYMNDLNAKGLPGQEYADFIRSKIKELQK